MSEATITEKGFSKQQAIDFGWRRAVDNLGFFIVYLIIVFLIQFFFNFFMELFVERLPLFSVAFYLGSFVVSTVFSIFYIKIGLRLYYNKKVGSLDFLDFNASTFFKFLLAYILYSIMVFIGFLLLVVPGIYLAIKYMFFQFLIIDKDMDVIEAFRESGKMTDGHKWNLFLFFLLIGLICILGALALLVGLFVAIPIVLISWTYVYKKLLSNQSSSTANTNVPPPPLPTQNDTMQSDSPFQTPT